MVAADNNGKSRQWYQQKTTACKIWRRTTTGKDKSGRQEKAETAEWRWWLRQRKMAAVDKNGGSGQQQQWQTMTAADDKGSGWWWHARSSRRLQGGRRRAGGKQQTTTALGPPAGRAESMKKIKKSSLCKKTFFSNMVCPVGGFTPAQTNLSPFRFCHRP